MTKSQYVEHSRECDGVCRLCATIFLGVADPMLETGYCPNCENRTVLGMRIAREYKFILITQ